MAAVDKADWFTGLPRSCTARTLFRQDWLKQLRPLPTQVAVAMASFTSAPLSAGALVDGWTVDSGRTLGIVSLYPLVDATMRLGSASYRPEYIFAVNGTIQTSDRREKQDIKELSEKELAVATRLKALIRTFRWKKSVAEKGDKARIHVGVIAQDVRDAFTQEGLDADSYSIFCYDKWDEISEVKDSDGNVTEPYRPAGDRYGVKYDALLAFIIAAL
jgi:hypothetical protein